MRSLPILTALVVAGPVFAVQDTAPEAYPNSRYEEMRKDSPFGLATAAAPVVPPKDSFTKEWVLTGLAKIRDEQGVERDFVSIKTRDQTQQFSLYGNKEQDGVVIASVERSPLVGKSKVTLKKGNEFGVVEFNQMEIEASIAGPGDGGGNRPPTVPGLQNPAGGPNRNPNGLARPQVPRPAGLPAPGAVIPRPTAPQQQINSAGWTPPGTAPNQAGQVGQPGKRIRVINSKP